MLAAHAQRFTPLAAGSPGAVELGLLLTRIHPGFPLKSASFLTEFTSWGTIRGKPEVAVWEVGGWVGTGRRKDGALQFLEFGTCWRSASEGMEAVIPIGKSVGTKWG